MNKAIGRNNLEVLYLIKPLAVQIGLNIELNILPERTFDVPVNILNSQKLHVISGWRPEIPVEEGIQRAWNSFLHHLKDSK